MTIAATATTIAYAGFWRRVLAYLIDALLVGLAVFALFGALALAFPKLADHVVLEAPHGMFTTDRQLEMKPAEVKIDGTTTVSTVEKVVERTVFGTWSYIYRVTETTKPGVGNAKPTVETDWQQLDPATRQPVSTTSLSSIGAFVMFVYMIVMDQSRYQGSFGKKAMDLTVTNASGGRLTLGQAIIRNVAKILSAVILLIGFLMIGWTQKKQGLHDKIAGALVVVDKT